MKTIRNLRLVGATGAIRTATYNEREHLVVPIVAMVEGVVWAVNSDVPEFVPAEELAQTPHQWNGRGCFAGHPEDGGSQVTANTPRTLEKSFGLIFDTVDATKILETRCLEFNTWLDPQKAQLVGAEASDVITRLRAGERVEVSIGCYVEAEEKDGTFDGQEYHSVWHNIVSDHLAFIAAGDKGACSIEAGCGAPRTSVRHLVRRNSIDITTQADNLRRVIERIKIEKETSMPAAAPRTAGSSSPQPQPTTNPPPGQQPSQPTGPNPSSTPATPPRKRLRDRMMALLAQIRGADGMSDTDLRYAVDSALRAVEPGYQGIDEIFPDGSDTLPNPHVIYYVMPTDAWTLKRQSYTLSGDNVVTLAADAVEVEAVTKYEPIRAAAAAHAPCSCGQQARQSEQQPTRGSATMREDVKALIDAGTFTKEDATWMEGVPAERLAALAAQAKKPADPPPAPAAAAPAPTPAPAPTTAAAATTATQTMSKEDWLQAAPAEFRDMYENKKREDAARHAVLVTELKTAQTVYSEDRLKAKSLSELEELALLVQSTAPVVDFSGRGAPRAASRGPKEDFTPPDPYAKDLEIRRAALKAH